ncbi:ATP-binding cassette sub-family C member 5-like [Amphiura filiformis]|uniref:ATP-binding cassette sub-family C member 5-like n=1 Tax=Amphiura filiformis TaxID=82378 RepID=UPI003B2257BE
MRVDCPTDSDPSLALKVDKVGQQTTFSGSSFHNIGPRSKKPLGQSERWIESSVMVTLNFEHMAHRKGVATNLKRGEAFSYLALLNATRVVIFGTPMAAKAIAETLVAMPRVKELLLMEEMEPIQNKPKNPANAIEISNATFAWDKESSSSSESSIVSLQQQQQQGEGKDNQQQQCLFDMNLVVKKGSLVGICGSIGSGKSSLISALLGRMVKMNGTVALKGSIGYVSQQACIFNATVKENILFGDDYDEERYAKAIDACSLQDDLDILAQGDETEIGERGINLSGGQKQRVSMARALYSDADVYLLDDPLSAVDTHVGQHIFRHCIKDMLQGNGKSVVFVTHQLQYLTDCDYVLLMRDGRIAEEGKHNELMTKDGEYANLIRTFHMDESEDNNDTLLDTSSNHESKTSLDGASRRSLTPSMDENELRPDFLSSLSDISMVEELKHEGW